MIKRKNKALTQNASPFPKYPSRTPIREVNTRFHPCGEAQCSAWGVGHQLCGALADQVDVQLAHLTKFTVVVNSTKLVIMTITTLKRGDFFQNNQLSQHFGPQEYLLGKHEVGQLGGDEQGDRLCCVKIRGNDLHETVVFSFFSQKTRFAYQNNLKNVTQKKF